MSGAAAGVAFAAPGIDPPVTRITATIVDGAWVAYGEAWIDGAWLQITGSIAPTITGDPEGLGATPSGTTLVWGAGSAVISSHVASEAQYVGWALTDIVAGLSLASPRVTGIRTQLTSAALTSGTASDYANLFGAWATSNNPATNLQYAVGLRCANSGNAAIRFVAAVTGLGSTGSSSASLRRVSYAGMTPVLAATSGTVIGMDVSDAYINDVNVGGTPGVTGTPTHLFVMIGASGTNRATVVSGAAVRFFV